jgi:hypothetical protein
MDLGHLILKAANNNLSEPKRKLDLRHVEEFKKFRGHRYTFGLRGERENITSHATTSAEEKEDDHVALENLLRQAIRVVARKGHQDNAIVHFFIHCTGMDQDFIHNYNQPRLKGLLRPNAVTEIADRFATIIQSGKDVYLDQRTVVTVMVFDPPPGFD